MKKHLLKKLAGLAVIALTLGGAATSMAATFLTTSYTNSFPIGANTADFNNSGSVASWIYWYNTGGNSANPNPSDIYCDVGIDANGNTNTSGAIEIDSPFLGVPNTQNVFFGTFGNQYGYDFSVEANLNLFTNITFDIMVAPGTPLTSSGNYGSIGVGIINANYGYQQFGSVTIPASAATNWAHMSVPVDKTQNNLSNVPGLAFDIANYGGYPEFDMTNYLDNIELHISPVKTPPPILSGNLQKPTPGLNEIATAAGGQYNRYQVETVANSGLGFLDQPSVTYSWNVQSFPNAAPSTFQQHFFIVDGVPGQYDQAADYNFANVIFMTVQEAANGQATFNFRYKTNEPDGNSMLFNATSPTNTVSDPNGWPIMPVCSLTAASPVGNWSVTFEDVTNVTITGPGGATTNFVLDTASAELFADPVTLLLGGQPNDPSGYGKGVVYGSFAETGNDAPFSDNFLTDTNLNTSIWKDLSSDPNGDILVPQGSAYWLNWSLPDAGFSLQTSSNLTATVWTDLTPTTITDNGTRQALLPASSLSGGNTGFFRLIERIPYQLQVLFPGETNAPNTTTGKVGTPTPTGSYDPVTVTVNEVDATWHILNGSADNISLTSSDSAATLPTPPPAIALSNGTYTGTVYFGTDGEQTITASDTDETNILSNTSSDIDIVN